ncbi:MULTISPECIES: DUF2188 domain-containing protein [Pontibacillus]|uniref:DUF2188 domain-containing protein n=1 Tax=Pontibacillus chungwhensis TaxID=265426 RepID=A0ABY8UZE5_9BACI|nr:MULTISPECIES: DUF2188 domain-containing protein [Pontibacillus]MCD5325433.1 DUF2188 domain-containing protein [Pontibacillus sp. HN14]WIF98548.1 DUF2188 domain-containing protein [Pontibacillus chungwhensis]
MPWDTKDYPSSLKNLETPVRKKAIDIANAMLDDGYDEDRAIPIATEQAKEWYDNATEKEINQVKQMSDQDLKKRDDQGQRSESRPELLEKGEHVVAHEEGWAVQTEQAKKPSDVFDQKQEAIDRAKEIAKNKGTKVIIHKKDGSIQDQTSYDS